MKDYLKTNVTIYKHESIITKETGAFGKPYILVFVPECEEVAGSGTRKIKECYRVVSTISGNRHSKAYKTLAEAQAELDRWTKPIIEQK
jgi:hypothetical protein